LISTSFFPSIAHYSTECKEKGGRLAGDFDTRKVYSIFKMFMLEWVPKTCSKDCRKRESFEMKRKYFALAITVLLFAALLGGCATYPCGYYDRVAATSLGVGAFGTALGYAATGNAMGGRAGWPVRFGGGLCCRQPGGKRSTRGGRSAAAPSSPAGSLLSTGSCLWLLLTSGMSNRQNHRQGERSGR
jgi:hypothetical protein